MTSASLFEEGVWILLSVFKGRVGKKTEKVVISTYKCLVTVISLHVTLISLLIAFNELKTFSSIAN